MGEASRTAWVVGGGTGIGRAAAQALAADGFHVVVSGRRAAELDGTLDAVHQSGGAASALVLDVTDDDAVQDAAERLTGAHGHLDALVYCAGTNVARRFWDQVSATDIAHVMDVNLQGAVRTVHAVLPGMRAAGAGLVVLVSSWAAWRHSPGAGAAYAMSKTALGVMAETLNAQERLHGIRATHLCPGEVATDILDTRPNPPSAEARALMLAPDDVGEAVAWIARQPTRVCVNELVLTPTVNTSYA